MGVFQDLTGNHYDRLHVVGPHSRVASRTKWFCRCACGAELWVNSSSLVRGLSRSCGCWSGDVTTGRNRTHGQAPRPSAGGRTPEYGAWLGMRERCGRPGNKSYHRYGGRGITVCPRWADFAAFYADMGPRPEGGTLERIDNNGNYEPRNCRWATRAEQAGNTRRNRPLTLNGRTALLADWARETDMSPQTISLRIDRLGWSVEKALTTPLRERRK